MTPLRHQMRRRDVPGTARFLTFSCYRRLALFRNDKIKDAFAGALAQAAARHNAAVLAWVVMPEHVHLVVYADPPESVSTFLRSLKCPLASAVLARWRTLDAPILNRLRNTAGKCHFWQLGGGYDRNVVDRELVEKIRYVHANPIRRGLSPDSVGWGWSSAATYRAKPDAIGPPIAFDLIPTYHGDLT
ncbi:MAG TPA: transposase [Tepidisphaeraceae bacterium]|jgi:putative transposase